MNRILAIAFILLTLTSCAKAPETLPVTSMSFDDRAQQLNQLNRWQINGKVAMQTARDSGSTSVLWNQRKGNYTITLYGAFGSGGIKLVGKPNNVVLTADDGKTYQSSSAEQLLANVWGFRLPVSNLNYWVRGLPAPTSAFQDQLDDANRLSRLVQQGYLVEYLAYKRVGKVDLPERIAITSADLKVKLVIYDWQI